jgi:hypothetical protein
MRKTIILAAALGLVFVADEASSKDFKLTSQQVKSACGDKLQGGGKNFGCTKCGGGVCRDYSCNGSGKGRQGCWERVLQRKVQQPGKENNRPLRTDNVYRRATPNGQPVPETGMAVRQMKQRKHRPGVSPIIIRKHSDKSSSSLF